MIWRRQMKNKELAKLVEAVRENKELNFERLLDEIGQTVYYLSWKILKDSHEAEDATQEAIAYIYNHLEDLASPEAFNQWMNRIVFGICHRMIEKKNKVQPASFIQEGDWCSKKEVEIGPEKIIEEKEKREILLTMIDQLPQKQKEVILLYYYEDLTTPEIAKMLDSTGSAIRNRLFLARKSIKEKIKKIEDKQGKTLFSTGLFLGFGKAFSEESKMVYTKERDKRIRQAINDQGVSFSKEITKPIVYHRKVRSYMILFLFLCVGSRIGAITYMNMKEISYENQKVSREKSFIQSSKMHQETRDRERNSKDTKDVDKRKDEIEDKKKTKEKVEEKALESSKVLKEDVVRKSTFSTKENVVTKKRDKKEEVLVEIPYTNTAVLEDEGLKDKVYEEDSINNKKGDSVYTSKEYDVDSNTVYFAVEDTKEKGEELKEKGQEQKGNQNEEIQEEITMKDGLRSPKTGDQDKVGTFILIFCMSGSLLFYQYKRKMKR